MTNEIKMKNGIKVTSHAIQRWRDKKGSGKSDIKIIDMIKNGVVRGYRAEVHGRAKLHKMLTYGADDESFFIIHGPTIFVIKESTVLTLYHDDFDCYTRSTTHQKYRASK